MRPTLSLITLCLAISLANISLVHAEESAPPEMMTYYFVLLTRGPKWTAEKTPEVQKIQEGHMANMKKIHEAGKLILAGPFTDNTKWSGLFVLKVASTDEARALVETDPAVKAGRLKYEIHPWMTQKGNIKDN